jgi:hypothetical protein
MVPARRDRIAVFVRPDFLGLEFAELKDSIYIEGAAVRREHAASFQQQNFFPGLREVIRRSAASRA